MFLLWALSTTFPCSYVNFCSTDAKFVVWRHLRVTILQERKFHGLLQNLPKNPRILPHLARSCKPSTFNAL